MGNQPIYDTRAAAEILGTTIGSLRKHILRGHVKTGRLGRKHLISQEEINRLSGATLAIEAATPTPDGEVHK